MSKNETIVQPSTTSNQPPAVPGFWNQHWLPALVLFLSGVVLYISSVGFDYVLDDKMVISENNFVMKGIAGIRDILSTDGFQGYFGEQRNLIVGGRYRPLSLVSFAVEHQFFGLNPKVSHFVNVLLYALTGVLLYRVLLLFSAFRQMYPWWRSLAFVSSLLFVLHPLHTEVVANIKSRDEILCMLLSLATLYCSFRFVQREKIRWLVASAGIFFLALLAKENALTFLAVVPLALYYFTGTSGKTPGVSWKKNALSLSPLLFSAVAYLLLRYRVMGYLLGTGQEITDLMNNPFYGMDTSQRLATAMYTLGAYLKLLVFPHPLTHDYYPYQVPISEWTDLPVIISTLAYFTMGIYALWSLPRKHLVVFSILFYLATLSIVSNIPFTVGTFMNERFLYMPSLGFCLILGWFICRQLPAFTEEAKGEFNLLSTALLAVFVIGFATKTWLRVPDWRNRSTLNAAAIKVSTNSARANCFMGVTLYEEQLLHETDPARRQQLIVDISYYIDRALAIYPDYYSAMTVKAGVLAEQYKYDQNLPQLLEGFYAIIARRKSIPFIDEYLKYLNRRGRDNETLAAFYLRAGRTMQQQFGDKAQAKKYFQYGLDVAPTNGQLQIEMSSLR
ncbi:MAG: glycosyltransferase family 39 protein [Bacteroidota bacterium]